MVEIRKNEKGTGYSFWQDGKKVGDVDLLQIEESSYAAQIAELEQRVERLEGQLCCLKEKRMKKKERQCEAFPSIVY